MIEVVTFTASGKIIDRAEADSPEGAVAAARTLMDDVCRVGDKFLQGIEIIARFYVDGKMVREIKRGDV